MSKEDRYSHLGDGPDEEPDTATDAHDADDTGSVASPDGRTESGESPGHERHEEVPEDGDGIRVTLSDGSKTVAVHVEDPGLTIDDLENNVEALFPDLDETTADSSEEAGESAPARTSGTTSIRSPMERGIRASEPVARAMIRSGRIGVGASVAWMRTLPWFRRRDT